MVAKSSEVILNFLLDERGRKDPAGLFIKKMKRLWHSQQRGGKRWSFFFFFDEREIEDHSKSIKKQTEPCTRSTKYLHREGQNSNEAGTHLMHLNLKLQNLSLYIFLYMSILEFNKIYGSFLHFLKNTKISQKRNILSLPICTLSVCTFFTSSA